MVVGQIAEAADLVVVGAGPGGYVAALRGAQLGRRVMLIDRDGAEGVGGVCLRIGCIPSKALIEAAELASRIDEASSFGIQASRNGVDMAQFQDWKNGVVGGLTDGVRKLLTQAGVSIEAGEGRLTKPDEAVIATPDGRAKFLKFQDLVFATGSRPIELPDLPFDGATILDSTGALDLTELPETLAIIGAGYIGLEIGIALAKFGAKVSIIEAEKGILPTMDRRLVRPVEKRLKALGIEVLASAQARGFSNGQLAVETKEGETTIAAEKVVVAVGRRANSDDLGLENAGIEADNQGLLAVAPDRRLTPHIAAIGDITPGPALAHKASAEAGVAVEALSGKANAFNPAAIPAVIFSDPEIATAGLTPDQAKAEGIEAESANFSLAASGRAATLNARDGFLQLVAEQGSDTVIGVHVVGPHASDLIAEGVLAIEMGASLEDLALTIHAHPTLSEVYMEAAHVGIGQPFHMAVLSRT